MSGAGRAEAIIARLHGLHPRLIDLSLGRLEILLEKMGHPERRLPPVIHVAGTNGKGSTCAFLRSVGEAAGWRVHVYISPHLVRFNERIRVAGTIVSDAGLEDALEAVETINGGAPITVFEVITAAAFKLFAEIPADVCVLEVGLGGRFDATNVVAQPAACAIAPVSIDHRDMLGETLAEIAFEKAGIIKPGIPVAVAAQPAEAAAVIAARAAELNATLLAQGRDWHIEGLANGWCYTDAWGSLALPPPSLPGVHQIGNAALAIATLRASGLRVPEPAFAGVARAEWPARLQRLTGRLAARLPRAWELWLDGGHNAGAGEALGRHLAGWADRPLHLIVGMKQTKDAGAFLAPLLPHAATVWAVAEPDQYLAQPIAAIIAASGGAAREGPTVEAALDALPTPGPPARVLICGSLYLAGEVLKRDGG